jgi:hypothetical protein
MILCTPGTRGDIINTHNSKTTRPIRASPDRTTHRYSFTSWLGRSRNTESKDKCWSSVDSARMEQVATINVKRHWWLAVTTYWMLTDGYSNHSTWQWPTCLFRRAACHGTCHVPHSIIHSDEHTIKTFGNRSWTRRSDPRTMSPHPAKGLTSRHPNTLSTLPVLSDQSSETRAPLDVGHLPEPV